MNQQELENRLHKEIPVSRFMQVRVTEINEDQAVLECALGPNHNHLGTAFGGSLSALMILAAYCQIFQRISAQGHVVLKSSSMQFLHPVEENLRAVCKAPDSKSLDSFLKTYQKKGKARLELESQIILSDGRIACTLRAEFVGIG